MSGVWRLVACDDGRLVIEPAALLPTNRLEELVEGMAAESRHDEVFSYGSIGNEAGDH
jgi:hypothetical protein